MNIGHGVEEIAEVAARQARRLAFAYSGTGTSRPQIDLANKLAAMAPKGMGEVKVFFCCGGSEATETALKLARQYYLARGKGGKYKFVGRWQGYHGNTIGALSITGRTQWREPFLPLLLGFPHICAPICYRCPLGKTYPECRVQCAWELERVLHLEGVEAIAGFMAEPIIGTSATAVTPPPEYYPIIRSICDEHDILMISDEVITGLGRTGGRTLASTIGMLSRILSLPARPSAGDMHRWARSLSRKRCGVPFGIKGRFFITVIPTRGIP